MFQRLSTMFAEYARLHPEKTIPDHRLFNPFEGDLFDWLETPYVRPQHSSWLDTHDPCKTKVCNEKGQFYAYEYSHLFERNVVTDEMHPLNYREPIVVDNVVRVRLTVITCFTESNKLFKVEIVDTKLVGEVSYLDDLWDMMEDAEALCLDHCVREFEAEFFDYDPFHNGKNFRL